MQDAKPDKTSPGPDAEPGSEDDRRQAAGMAPPSHDRDPEGTMPDETDIENANAPMRDGDRIHDLLLFVPRLLQLIGRLVVDPEVPLLDKMILGAAAAYVMSPLDILPDAVPLIGQLDDIYLIAICLLRLMHRSGEAKLRQHWQGPEDIVQILHTVTDFATRYLPGGLRTRLRGWVEAKPST